MDLKVGANLRMTDLPDFSKKLVSCSESICVKNIQLVKVTEVNCKVKKAKTLEVNVDEDVVEAKHNEENIIVIEGGDLEKTVNILDTTEYILKSQKNIVEIEEEKIVNNENLYKAKEGNEEDILMITEEDNELTNMFLDLNKDATGSVNSVQGEHNADKGNSISSSRKILIDVDEEVTVDELKKEIQKSTVVLKEHINEVGFCIEDALNDNEFIVLDIDDFTLKSLERQHMTMKFDEAHPVAAISLNNVKEATTVEHRASECVKEQSHTEINIKKEMEEAARSAAHIDNEIDLNHLKQEPGLVHLGKSEPALLVKEEILKDTRQGYKEPLKTVCRVHLMRLDTFHCELCDAVYVEKRRLLQHLQTVHRSRSQASSFVKFHYTNKQQATGKDEKRCVPATSTRASVAADSDEISELLHIKGEMEDADLDIGPTVLQPMDSHYGTGQTDLNCIKEENTVLKPEEVLPGIYNGQVARGHVRDDTIDRCGKNKTALAQYINITSIKGVVQSQIYLSDVCKKTFKTKNAITSHINFDHGTSLLKCPECKKRFKRRQYLRIHIMNIHGHQKQKMCEICGKVFKGMQFLNIHIKTVHGTEPSDSSPVLFTCDYCLKQFHLRQSLVVHLKNMHASKSYTCEVCKKNFKCQKYLSKHVKIVHGVEEHKLQPFNPSPCDKCQKVFKSELSLRLHSKLVHATESHKCTRCNKEFKCKPYLLRHVQGKHSEEQYQCDICKKMYKSWIMRRRHVLSCHRSRSAGSNIMPTHNYTCDHCQKSFTVKQSLQQHIAGVHGERIHSCLKCNKTYKSKLQLQVHNRNTHGKHVCELCSRRFTVRYKLRTHVKKAHGLDDISSKSD